MKTQIEVLSPKWSFVSVPDDLELQIESGGRSQRIDCSAEDLIVIYYHLISGSDYEDYIGIGSRVKIETMNGRCSLDTRDLDCNIDKNRATNCLHSILRKVFETKDAGSPEKDRQNAMRAVYTKHKAAIPADSPEEIYSAIL